MKKILLTIIFLCLAYFSLPLFAVEKLTLDPNHTYVLWHISHFGFSSQAGKWYATGTLEVDKDKPENSKVNASVKVAEMATGHAELDKHLKGKLFFDVEHFPTATFVSNKVDVISKDTARVHGTLTLRGVTKPLTLDVKLNKVGMSPITNKMTAGFTATTTIKRSDFGMNTLIPGLSDEVQIQIEAEAYK